MHITPKFNLILTNKVEKKVNEHTNFQTNPDQEADTFTRTDKSQVSFKAKSPVNQLQKMLQSTTYLKVLGLTIASTAAALWQQLLDAGVKEEDINLEEITKQLTKFVLGDANKTNVSNDKVTTAITEKQEDVIDIKPEAQEKADKINKAEAKNKEQVLKERLEIITQMLKDGHSQKEIAQRLNVAQSTVCKLISEHNIEKPKRQALKTVKLQDGQQADINNAKAKYEENLAKVKELAAQGVHQAEIARRTGISELKVSRMVKKHNIPTAKKQKIGNFNDMPVEKVLEIFEQNKTKSRVEVASIFNLSVNKLDSLCKKRGIPLFKTKQPDEYITTEMLNQDIANGLTNNEIADKYEVSIIIIRELLSELKIVNPNIKQRVVLTKDLLKAVNADYANGVSTNELVKKYNISPATVGRIISGKITTFRIDLEELANKGYTMEDAAKELGKEVSTIKKSASRYGINFATTQQVENNDKADKADKVDKVDKASEVNKPEKPEKTEDVELLKVDKSIFKDYLHFDSLSYMFATINLDENAKNIIKQLQDDNKKIIDVLKQLDAATLVVRTQKGSFNKFLNSIGVKANATETPVRYSTEDLVMRYIARSYNLFKKQAPEKLESFIEATTSPRDLFTTRKVNFEKNILAYKDEPIPENDPLFERYKACFDTKQMVLQTEILKQKYINKLADKIVTDEALEALKKCNHECAEIDKMHVFNYVRYGLHNEQTTTLKVPEIKNDVIDDVETASLMAEEINRFKNRKNIYKYVDLVTIYNSLCQDINVLEDVYGVLSSVKDTSRLTKEEEKKIINLINKYLHSSVAKEASTENVEVLGRNYKSQDIDSLLGRLDDYLKNADESELSYRVIDFSSNFDKTSDVDTLISFLAVIDDYKLGNITEEDAINICVENNLLPLNSEYDKLQEILHKENMAKKKANLIIELNNKLSQIFDFVGNSEIRHLIDYINSDKVSLAVLAKLSEEVLELETMTKFDISKAQEKLTEINRKYLQFDLDEAQFQEKVNQYSQLLDNDEVINDDIKQFVKTLYLNNKASKDELNKQDAIELLMQIDKYNELPENEKAKIHNLLEIFDVDKSKNIKRVAEKIIEKDYLNLDTVVYNKDYGVDVIITAKPKQEIWERYRKFDIFENFEYAASVKAKAEATCGLKDLTINNKDPEYSMEIKLVKLYRQARLYSVLKRDKNRNLINNFEFTKFDPQHKLKKG